MLAHGDDGRQDLILAACRRNTIYDYQCEESHGWYLAELLFATGKPDEYLARLIAEGSRAMRRRDRDQWAEMLTEASHRGSKAARQYIAATWESELGKDRGQFAAAFITVEGAKAYREVLRWIVAHWQGRRKVVGDAWSLHDAAVTRLGEKKAMEMRSGLPLKIAKISDSPDVQPIYPSPPPVAEKPIEERILAGNYVSTRRVTPDELVRIANLMEQDLPKHALRRALLVFQSHPFPRELALLEQHLDHEDPFFAGLALGALGRNKSAAVRKRAFEDYPDPWRQSEAIAVLAANYEPGDEVWILARLRECDRLDSHHGSAMNAFDVLKANPTANFGAVLSYILANVRCQLCRLTAAELLQARRLLTAEEILALRLDAYHHTRKWAAKVSPRRSPESPSRPA